MESVFRAEVERVQRDGATVLLSSHILSEVEQLCDRVTIIRVRQSPSRPARSTSCGTSPAPASGSEPAPRSRSSRRSPACTTPAAEAEHLVFDVDTDAIDSVLRTVTAAGVTSLTVTPPSLEELFLRHYGDHVEAPVEAA